MWIGCKDLRSDGQFFWVHNNQRVNFTNWFQGEPNDGGPFQYEDCCMIGHEAMEVGKWNDVACEHHKIYPIFICKKSM